MVWQNIIIIEASSFLSLFDPQWSSMESFLKWFTFKDKDENIAKIMENINQCKNIVNQLKNNSNLNLNNLNLFCWRCQNTF